MAKGQDSKKAVKKKPEKTMKEKRQEKKGLHDNEQHNTHHSCSGVSGRHSHITLRNRSRASILHFAFPHH